MQDYYNLEQLNDLIGSCYFDKHDFTKALLYYLKAKSIAEQIGDNNNVSSILCNIGNVYGAQDKHKDALENYFQALAIEENLGNKANIATVLGNIGLSYLELKEYAKVEKYLLSAMTMDKEVGALKHQIDLENHLANFYANTNRHKLAFVHYTNALVLKDSIFNDEKNKEITRHEMNYEFEKKEMATRAKQDKKDAIANEELKSKEQQRNYFFVGFALVLVLALFILRGYRQKRKANLTITKQKKEVEKKNHIIEEKQKEIIDSIRYAKRIQNAVLPSEKYILRKLSQK